MAFSADQQLHAAETWWAAARRTAIARNPAAQILHWHELPPVDRQSVLSTIKLALNATEPLSMSMWQMRKSET